MTKIHALWLVLLCVCCYTQNSQAQIFFTEDFEGATNATTGLPATWTETGLSLDGIYSVGTSADASAGGYWPVPAHTIFAQTNDDVCGATCDKSEDRLILPAQDFSAIAGGVNLIADIYMDGLYGGSGQVEVSTDGGINWTNVYTMPTNTTWQDATVIPLNAYVGPTFTNVLIAFHYDDGGNWATGLGVDNVQLEEIPATDASASVDSIVGEYTQIPLDHVTIMTLEATVSNAGPATATGGVLTTNVYVAPNFVTPVQTTTANLASLASGTSTQLNSGTYTPAGVGTYRVEHIFSSTTNDPNLADNTAIYDFAVTDSTYARDTTVTTGDGGLGLNGTTVGIMGQTFTLEVADELTSVTFAANAPLTGDTVGVHIYNTDPVTGAPTTVLSTTEYIFPSDGGVHTVSIPSLNLAAGTYYVGIEEYITTAASGNMGLVYTNSIYTGGKSWLNIDGGAFFDIAAPPNNFEIAFYIRPNFGVPPVTTCDAGQLDPLLAGTTANYCIGDDFTLNTDGTEITPTGGTYAWSFDDGVNAPILIILGNGAVPYTGALPAGLIPGTTYTVTGLMADANLALCSQTTTSFTLNVLPLPDMVYTASYNCTTGNVDINVTNIGTDGPYVADVDGGAPITISTAGTFSVPGPFADDVTLTLTMTAGNGAGCSLIEPVHADLCPMNCTTPTEGLTDNSFQNTGWATSLILNGAPGSFVEYPVSAVVSLDADSSLWLGGAAAVATTEASQTFTIPTTTGQATLSFWCLIPVCDSPNDSVNILVDGNLVATPITGGSAFCGDDLWHKYTVDLTSFADGLNHTLTLQGAVYATNGSNSNFFVDQVSLEICACNLTAAATGTNIDCTNATGTATVTGSNGTTPYTYAWNNGATTAGITNLLAGTYTVTVTDAGGCTATSSYTVVDNSITLAGSSSSTQNTDCTTPNGTATVTPTNGATPYTYLWSDGQTTQTATGLPAGTYAVTITDVNGCTGVVSGVGVSSSAGPSATATSNDVTCNGGNDGAITVTATGGTTPYTYAWSNGGTTAALTGLTANTYTCTITDATGCVFTLTEIVGEPSAIVISTNSLTDVTCTQDGAIDIGVTGGSAPYTYTWSNASTTEDLSGLTSGSYTVTVTDINACTATQTFTINNNATVLTITGAATDAGCSPSGTATATPTNGAAPYTFVWSDGQTTQTATALSSGTYNCTVTDANGCTGTTAAVVNDNAITITGSSTTTPVTDCATNDGTATATATNGAAPYTYLWSDGQTTQTATGLGAGSYSVTVTDASGCTGVISNVTVSSNVSTPTATINITDVSCNGEIDGAIDLVVAGGTSPYTFAWSNGATTEDLSNVAAGTYTCTITDNNNCTYIANATVAEPTALSAVVAVVTDAGCAGNDGGVDVNVAGGTLPYTYIWDNGATTEDLSNVVAGSYGVTVTDGNGCTASTTATVGDVSIVINAAANTTQANCGAADGTATLTPTNGQAPYTYVWSNGQTTQTAVNLLAGSYAATITDANGCTGVITNVNVASSGGLTASAAGIDVDCNGANTGEIDLTATGGSGNYSYLWNDANASTTEDVTGLVAGTYNVTVTDLNTTCTFVVTTIINEPTAIDVINLQIVDATCFGNSDGEIDMNVTGGVAPYIYSWDNGSNSEDLTGLIAGAYELEVTDANGCVETSGSLVVGEPAEVSVSLAATNPTTVGGTDGAIDATVTGGTAPYTYAWSTGGSTQDLSGLPAATYSVTVTDANGCSGIQTVTLVNPTSVTAVDGMGSLNLYPNPTSGLATLELELLKVSTEVTIEIMDMRGRLIQVIQDTNVQTQQYGLDLTGFAGGVYLIRVSANDQVATRRLIMTK